MSLSELAHTITGRQHILSGTGEWTNRCCIQLPGSRKVSLRPLGDYMWQLRRVQPAAEINRKTSADVNTVNLTKACPCIFVINIKHTTQHHYSVTLLMQRATIVNTPVFNVLFYSVSLLSLWQHLSVKGVRPLPSIYMQTVAIYSWSGTVTEDLDTLKTHPGCTVLATDLQLVSPTI